MLFYCSCIVLDVPLVYVQKTVAIILFSLLEVNAGSKVSVPNHSVCGHFPTPISMYKGVPHWGGFAPMFKKVIFSGVDHSNVYRASDRHRVPTIFWYWNSRTFQWLSRTLKLHFQGPILDGSLQHGQYYSHSWYLFLWLRNSFSW